MKTSTDRILTTHARWEMREFSEFYASDSLVPAVASRPTCIGPIKYIGQQALKRDLPI